MNNIIISILFAAGLFSAPGFADNLPIFKSITIECDAKRSCSDTKIDEKVEKAFASLMARVNRKYGDSIQLKTWKIVPILDRNDSTAPYIERNSKAAPTGGFLATFQFER